MPCFHRRHFRYKALPVYDDAEEDIARFFADATRFIARVRAGPPCAAGKYGCMHGLHPSRRQADGAEAGASWGAEEGHQKCIKAHQLCIAPLQQANPMQGCRDVCIGAFLHEAGPGFLP